MPTGSCRTFVWGPEKSGSALTDLVYSLPDSAIARLCEEEAIDLTYTFLAGPVGPYFLAGSAPWDTTTKVGAGLLKAASRLSTPPPSSPASDSPTTRPLPPSTVVYSDGGVGSAPWDTATKVGAGLPKAAWRSSTPSPSPPSSDSPAARPLPTPGVDSDDGVGSAPWNTATKIGAGLPKATPRQSTPSPSPPASNSPATHPMPSPAMACPDNGIGSAPWDTTTEVGTGLPKAAPRSSTPSPSPSVSKFPAARPLPSPVACPDGHAPPTAETAVEAAAAAAAAAAVPSVAVAAMPSVAAAAIPSVAAAAMPSVAAAAMPSVAAAAMPSVAAAMPSVAAAAMPSVAAATHPGNGAEVGSYVVVEGTASSRAPVESVVDVGVEHEVPASTAAAAPVAAAGRGRPRKAPGGVRVPGARKPRAKRAEGPSAGKGKKRGRSSRSSVPIVTTADAVLAGAYGNASQMLAAQAMRFPPFGHFMPPPFFPGMHPALPVPWGAGIRPGMFGAGLPFVPPGMMGGGAAAAAAAAAAAMTARAAAVKAEVARVAAAAAAAANDAETAPAMDLATDAAGNATPVKETPHPGSDPLTGDVAIDAAGDEMAAQENPLLASDEMAAGETPLPASDKMAAEETPPPASDPLASLDGILEGGGVGRDSGGGTDGGEAAGSGGTAAIMGEETCMALFGGGEVELLMERPPSAPQLGVAVAEGEGGNAAQPAQPAQPTTQQEVLPPSTDSRVAALTPVMAPGAVGAGAGVNTPPPVSPLKTDVEATTVIAETTAGLDTNVARLSVHPASPGVHANGEGVVAAVAVVATAAAAEAAVVGAVAAVDEEPTVDVLAEWPSVKSSAAAAAMAGKEELRTEPSAPGISSGAAQLETPRIGGGDATAVDADTVVPPAKEPRQDCSLSPPVGARVAPTSGVGDAMAAAVLATANGGKAVDVDAAQPSTPPQQQVASPPPGSPTNALPVDSRQYVEEEEEEEEIEVGASAMAPSVLEIGLPLANQHSSPCSNAGAPGALETGSSPIRCRVGVETLSSDAVSAAGKGDCDISGGRSGWEAIMHAASLDGVAGTAETRSSGSGGGDGAMTVFAAAAESTAAAVMVKVAPAPVVPSSSALPSVTHASAATTEGTLPSQGTDARNRDARSVSNGGEPASFGSSGGGCSSPPEGADQRVAKKARRAPASVPGTLPFGPKPGAALAETSAVDRQKRGTRDCVASADVVRGVAETQAVAATSGGPPQRAASPMVGPASSEGRGGVAAAAATSVTTAAAAAPTPVSARPFAFAAAAQKVGFRSSGRNEPPPAASTPVLSGAAVAVDSAAVAPTPTARVPVPDPTSVSARPFAFAAGAKKGENVEVVGGEQAAKVTSNAAVHAKGSAAPGVGEGRAEPSLAPKSSRHALGPPLSKNAFEVPLPADGLTSLFAALDGGNVALTESMSPAEVQAGYSEAWSSLPSCFWEEPAIPVDGGGGVGRRDKLVVESPVTRWLGLPQTVSSLEHPNPSVSASPSPLRAGKGGDDGSGTGTVLARAVPRGSESSAALTGQADPRSGWAMSGAEGDSGSAAASAAAAVPSPAFFAAPTRAAEETRSLPTLIRLGRSMTKGVSPAVEADAAGKADEDAEKVAKDKSCSRPPAPGSDRGHQTARAAGSNSAASAPATSSRASAPFKAFGTVPAGNRNRSGGGSSGGGGGSGSSKPRDGGTGEGWGKGVGREADAEAAEVALALALMGRKKKRRKKSRIAPTFVSSLPPAMPAMAPAAFSKRTSA